MLNSRAQEISGYSFKAVCEAFIKKGEKKKPQSTDVRTKRGRFGNDILQFTTENRTEQAGQGCAQCAAAGQRGAGRNSSAQL